MQNQYNTKVRSMGTDKMIFLIVGGLTVVILGIAAVVFGSGSSAKPVTITSYKSTDSERPKADVGATFSDLGKMKVSEEKKAGFKITNSGTKPLELSEISSSCDCTFATVAINGTNSPEFGMHSKGGWVGSVDPGKSADVTVIYRPYIMPVHGVITRDVYVRTNDPDKPEVTLTVKADVE